MHGQGRDDASGEARDRLDDGGREGVGRGPAVGRRDYPGHSKNEERLLLRCMLDGRGRGRGRERGVSVHTIGLKIVHGACRWSGMLAARHPTARQPLTRVPADAEEPTQELVLWACGLVGVLHVWIDTMFADCTEPVVLIVACKVWLRDVKGLLAEEALIAAQATWARKHVRTSLCTEDSDTA